MHPYFTSCPCYGQSEMQLRCSQYFHKMSHGLRRFYLLTRSFGLNPPCACVQTEYLHVHTQLVKISLFYRASSSSFRRQFYKGQLVKHHTLDPHWLHVLEVVGLKHASAGIVELTECAVCRPCTRWSDSCTKKFPALSKTTAVGWQQGSEVYQQLTCAKLLRAFFRSAAADCSFLRFTLCSAFSAS